MMKKNYFDFNHKSVGYNDSDIIYNIINDKKLDKIELIRFLSDADINILLYLADLLRYNSKSKITTYSRKVFINLTNLCKDTCSYCTYRKEPINPMAIMLKPDQVISMAFIGKKYQCTEALIVTGERPELVYPEARLWLHQLGFKSLIELISHLSERILKETGLLPHTNAGSLTKKEMSNLKQNNVSIGMMLENSSPRLANRGMVHEFAPSKNPKLRVKSLVSAGELKYPTTTGLLVGIGESFTEFIESLLLLNEINVKYGHIQEVIIQNFTPKIGTSFQYENSPSFSYFIRCICAARIILKNTSLQVPPNLSPFIFGNYHKAGIDDWGGISPITPDFVNPEYPWPTITEVKKVTNNSGFTLRARLPIYSKYIVNHDLFSNYIHDNLKGYILPMVDKYGLVKEDNN